MEGSKEIKDTNDGKVRKQICSLRKEHKKDKRQQHIEKLVRKFKEEKKDNMKRGIEKGKKGEEELREG